MLDERAKRAHSGGMERAKQAQKPIGIKINVPLSSKEEAQFRAFLGATGRKIGAGTRLAILKYMADVSETRQVQHDH